MAAGFGEVWLPDALAVKYPNAARTLAWQYVFPAEGFSTDPRSGAVRRHHVDEKRVQRAVKRAAARAGMVVVQVPDMLVPDDAARALGHRIVSSLGEAQRLLEARLAEA